MSRHFRFNKHLSLLTVPVLLLTAHGKMQADPVTITSLVSASGVD